MSRMRRALVAWMLGLTGCGSGLLAPPSELQRCLDELDRVRPVTTYVHTNIHIECSPPPIEP